MKRLFLLIAALFATLGAMSRPADNLRKVPLADPFILLYDGVYYAYGTCAESGIEVWISREMYISDVRFRCRQGRCLMEIDPGYTTPVIAE